MNCTTLVSNEREVNIKFSFDGTVIFVTHVGELDMMNRALKKASFA